MQIDSDIIYYIYIALAFSYVVNTLVSLFISIMVKDTVNLLFSKNFDLFYLGVLIGAGIYLIIKLNIFNKTIEDINTFYNF